jgi:hypothetical protein
LRQQAGASCPTREQVEWFRRLSARERDAYTSGLRAGLAEPMAPVRLPYAAGLIAIEAGIEALVEDRLARVVCAWPLSVSVAHLRAELEQQRAREIGLTPVTAPQPRVNWEWVLASLLWFAYVHLRGGKSTKTT